INHRSTASAESCRVHFRGQVMMVVDETFAEQFVKQRNEYEGVGRIVGVDRIKAFAKESHDRKREGGSHRVGVFPKVSEKTIRRSKCEYAYAMAATFALSIVAFLRSEE